MIKNDKIIGTSERERKISYSEALWRVDFFREQYSSAISPLFELMWQNLPKNHDFEEVGEKLFSAANKFYSALDDLKGVIEKAYADGETKRWDVRSGKRLLTEN